MTISKACLGLAFLCMALTASFAAEKSYVCAVHEVFECVAVKGCTPITLAAANLAAVMWLDLEKKTLTTTAIGQKPTVSELKNVTVTDNAVLLHGLGKSGTSDRVWSAIISTKTGKLSAGVSTPDASLALQGRCTTKP
jgi:hypothetical protein